MKRRRIWWVLLALMALLAGAVAWLFATESGLRWAYARAHGLLPGTLDVQKLDGRLAGPLHIEGLRYRDASTDVRVDRLTFDWSPLALLAGRLHVQDLTIGGVQVTLPPPKDTQAPARAPRFPLALRVDRLELTDIRIARPGGAAYALQSLEVEVRIDADRIQIDRLEALGQNFQVSAHGALDLHAGSQQLALQWRVTPPGLAEFVGGGEIVGNLKDFTVTQRLSAPVSAELRAKIAEATTNTRWDAQLDLPPASLARLKPNLRGSIGGHIAARGEGARFRADGALKASHPNAADIDASFKAHGSTAQIDIDELVLVAPAGSKLTGAASYRPGTNAFDAKVSWRDLRWPLTGKLFVASPAGEIKIDGTLAAYRLTLAAQTQGGKLPPAEWNLAGAGNNAHIGFETLTVKTLGGTIQGNARVAWSPRLAWDAHLDAKGLNPGVMWHDWPGALAFAARASASDADLDVDVAELGGQLRGQPVSANGRLVRRGNAYPVIAANVQHANVRASVAGQIDRRWDVKWEINAPNVASLLPRAGGSVQAAGTVGGERDTPTVQGRLAAVGLAYEEFRVGKLDVDASVDFSDRSGSRIDVQLADADVTGRRIDRASLHLDGPLSRHTLSLDIATPQAAARVRFDGAYDDKVWRATLVESVLTLDRQNWTLTNRPALAVSASRIKLERACWSAAPSRLCAGGGWTDAGALDVDALAERVPLALFAPLTPDALQLHGRLDADARVSVNGGRITAAEARVDVTDGNARLITSDTGVTFNYRRVHAELHVDAAGLTSEAALALANGDGGNARVILPQFTKSPGAAQPVEGQLALKLRDITPFAALLPDVRDLKGAVRADVALRGTLTDPVVRGQAQLTDGNARITRNGILIRDARLVASSDGGRDIQLNGYARSGNGELGLSGHVALEKNLAWRAELRLAGHEFQAVDLPEADVLVSPDLHARAAPGEIDIDGALLIPRARLSLRSRPASVAPSPDVVVVGGNEDNAPARRWTVSSKIQLTLGDNVVFDGFGLSGNVTGSLTLTEAPGEVATARGELGIVNGKYEAYGQKLEIERGRLYYAGGPVDDPGIEVRAVRHIEHIVAGVEVRGTLKAAQLTLFSDPSMSDSDTLSYLLFGKPVESASAAQGATLAAAARALKLTGGERIAQRLAARFGIEDVEIEKNPTTDQAALVLGKHLSPRLYINYSIGLFESVNVFRIRYQLATHWILQAESGANKGGDLLYTIER